MSVRSRRCSQIWHPFGGVNPPLRRSSLAVMTANERPIRIALVDDYDVVVVGVANMLEPYRDRIVVAELDTGRPVKDEVDIALYDSFAQPESDQHEIKVLVDNPRARRVAVYTWNFHPELVESARDLGVGGYLSKALTARELVAALEAVHRGEVVVSEASVNRRTRTGLDWPGRREGLSDRESEILALITQGKTNSEVAALTYLSPNTIKSYIRSLYRKIDVESRTQAVLWGVRHGFLPDHNRIDHWRGGP
jgi:DNA-binding NarL/FixJ family response regulator